MAKLFKVGHAGAIAKSVLGAEGLVVFAVLFGERAGIMGGFAFTVSLTVALLVIRLSTGGGCNCFGPSTSRSLVRSLSRNGLLLTLLGLFGITADGPWSPRLPVPVALLATAAMFAVALAVQELRHLLEPGQRAPHKLTALTDSLESRR